MEKTRVLTAMSLALPLLAAFVHTLHIYIVTHGGIVVGGDFVGFYDYRETLLLLEPTSWLYGISLFITLNNIYLGYYVFVFLGLVINLYVLRFFIRSVIRPFAGIEEKHYLWALLVVEIAAYTGFILNPTLLVSCRLAAYQPSIINYTAPFIILSLIINDIRGKNVGRKRLAILLLIASFLIAWTPYPNNIRLIAGTVLVSAIFIIIMSIITKTKLYKSNFLKIITFMLLLSILFILIRIYIISAINGVTVLELIGKRLRIAAVVAKAHHYMRGSNVVAAYATPLNVLRLFGEWAFLSPYAPYHYLYEGGNNLITLASFVWALSPALALLIARYDYNSIRRKIILTIELLTIIIITWNLDGTLYITKIIHVFISDVIPYIEAVFPLYFLSSVFLKVFYILFIVYIIYIIIISNGKGRSSCSYRNRHSVRNVVSKAIIVLMLVLLVVIAAWPILTGYAYAEYWNRTIVGIRIPSEYFNAKTLLDETSGNNATVLLYPLTLTYVQLSWGYQGSSLFYNRFFYPIKILNLMSYGGYAEYSVKKIYINRFFPLLMPRSVNVLNLTNIVKKISVTNDIKYFILGNRNTIRVEYNCSKYYKMKYIINIIFKHSLNLINYTFIIIDFYNLSRSAYDYLINIINNNSLWIGLYSQNGSTGWYIFGSNSTNKHILILNDTIRLYLRLGKPDKPWPMSRYDVSNVLGIIIAFNSKNINKVSFCNALKVSLSVSLGRGLKVEEDYLNRLKDAGVMYILFDKSVINGYIGNKQYYHDILDLMEKNKYIVNIFSSKLLELYKINITRTR